MMPFQFVCQNETFMITGRSSNLSDGSVFAGTEKSFDYQDNRVDNWTNDSRDDYGGSSSVHALSWKDGVAVLGVDLLNAWGVTLENSVPVDDPLIHDSDIDDMPV